MRPSRDAPDIGPTGYLRVATHYGEWFVTVPGEPVAKPRHRAARGVHYSTARQVAAEELIARCAREQNVGRERLRGPVRLSVVFFLPATKSHPAGTQADGKPDADNLVKLVCDGMNKAGCWEDDARVTTVECLKVHGRRPVTLIAVRPALGWPTWAHDMAMAAGVRP